MKLGEKTQITLLIVGFVLFLAVVVCLLANGTQLSVGFRESLIVELIGAGFVTLFVSLTMILIQHLFAANVEKIRAKRESLAWIEEIMEPEFKSEFEKGATPWNMNEREDAAFYFHDSPINRIYDLIMRHHENILRHAGPSDSMFLARLLEIKRIVEEGRGVGSKIDLDLRNRVRSFNKNRNANSANDGSLFVYARAKIFSNLTETKILEHIKYGNDKIRGEFMKTLDNATINAWREKIDHYKEGHRGALYKMGYKVNE